MNLRQLAADLQDTWHYFDTAIAGEGNFSERLSHTLWSRLDLYKNGQHKLVGVMEVLPYMRLTDDANGLPTHKEIETDAELKKYAKEGRSIAEAVGKKLGIDAYAGEVL